MITNADEVDMYQSLLNFLENERHDLRIVASEALLGVIER